MESVAPQLQEKWEKYLGPDLAVSTGDHRDVCSAVLSTFPPFFGRRNQNRAITNSDCLTAEMIFMTLAESQQLKEPKTSFLPSTKRNALTIESCFRVIKGWVTFSLLHGQLFGRRVGSLRRSSSKPSENSPYFGINFFVHTIYSTYRSIISIYFYQDTIRTVHFFMLFSSTTHNLPNSENSDDDAAWLFARPRDAAGFRGAVRQFFFSQKVHNVYIGHRFSFGYRRLIVDLS